MRGPGALQPLSDALARNRARPEFDSAFYFAHQRRDRKPRAAPASHSGGGVYDDAHASGGEDGSVGRTEGDDDVEASASAPGDDGPSPPPTTAGASTPRSSTMQPGLLPVAIRRVDSERAT